MSNLNLLIKTSIINEFNLNKKNQLDKKEKYKYIVLVLGIAIFIAYLIYGIFKMCFKISDILIKNNILDLMLVASFVCATLFCLFTTLYKASSYLFSAKDFELLSSLPLKESEILISKIFMLLMTNYLFSLPIIFIPGIVYGIKMNVNIIYYIYLTLLFLSMPLIPITMASIISFGLTKISSKVKYKNIVLILGSIILILVYFVVISKIQDLGIVLIKNNKSIVDTINKIYFMTVYFVNSLVYIDIISIIKFIVISVLIFIIFTKVFAKQYKLINSEMKETYKNKSSKIIRIKSDGTIITLLKKEIIRYFSSYVYVLNSSIGMILLPIFSIAIFILGVEQVSQILEMNIDVSFIRAQIILVITFCIITSCITHCTISLEGKNLWILKSLPIRVLDIFKAKIALNLLLTIPITIISFIVISIKLRFDLLFTVIGILFIVSTCFLIPILGLLLNLIYPNLEWKNEITVIKKGIPLILILVISVIYIFILGFIYLKSSIFTFSQFILGVSIINFFIIYILWSVIKNKGIELFKTI